MARPPSSAAPGRGLIAAARSPSSTVDEAASSLELPRAEAGPGLRPPLLVGAGTFLLLAATVLFIAIWWRVIIGHRVLVGGDILYLFPPWSGAAGAHPPVNPLGSDVLTQFLPWLPVTADAYRHAQLALWDPYALAGKPLLADDVSATLSPFTLLALPFSAAYGLSISMLARMLVAGAGMFVFLRLLRARPLSAGTGAIAYAACSFMVLWLAWPQAGVAALMPWLFAAAEWQLRRPGFLAEAALAVVVCLQFLSGHAETSFHVAVAAGIYCLVRCFGGVPGRLGSLAGMAAAVAIGTAAAGIQLVPFIKELRDASLISERQAVLLGGGHPPLRAALSWLTPNLHGNPAIDGLPGWLPNYNETAGFAGASSLILAGVGVWRHWLRERSVVVGLATVGVFGALCVYGPLLSVLGRLPGFDVSNNGRMILLICFSVAALAGLGIDAVVDRPRRPAGWLGDAALMGGLAGLLGVGGLDLVFAILRGRAEHLVPFMLIPGAVTFWLLVAFFAMGATALLLAAGRLRGGTLAPAALATVVLLEMALFAGPQLPQVSPREVPPPSATMDMLVAHSSDRYVVATGRILPPETTTFFGLHDVRGYDVVRPARAREYWAHADAGYREEALYTVLERPDARWLAASGVAYVVAPGNEAAVGTTPVFRGEGVTIGEVPGVRPFAFIASSAVVARPQDAALIMGRDPLGPVVLEGACCPVTSPADIRRVVRGSQAVEVEVQGGGPSLLVLLQTYTPDWKATIDGRPVQLMPADVLFQGVQVPAGHHTVRVSYQPAAVTTGALLSAGGVAAVAVLVALGLLTLRGRRKGRGSPISRWQ